MSKIATEKSYTNEAGAPEITPETLRELAAQVTIIDVRRPEEFNGELGHISGAALSTLETNFEKDLESWDKSNTYVFVCRSGGRSTNATLLAKSKGFSNAFNMKGGMLRWNALQFPIEK